MPIHLVNLKDGGVTASLIAFTYFVQHRDNLKGEVFLTLVPDEETAGRWGSRWLFEYDLFH